MVPFPQRIAQLIHDLNVEQKQAEAGCPVGLDRMNMSNCIGNCMINIDKLWDGIGCQICQLYGKHDD